MEKKSILMNNNGINYMVDTTKASEWVSYSEIYYEALNKYERDKSEENKEELDRLNKYEERYGIDRDAPWHTHPFYRNYVSKFQVDWAPRASSFDDLDEQDTLKFVVQLIAASLSSEYQLALPKDTEAKTEDGETLIDVLISVSSKQQLNEETKEMETVSITKSLEDLWTFQIVKLIEIYCKEQIHLLSLIDDDDNEDVCIKKEMEDRLKYYKLKRESILDDVWFNELTN